MKLSWIVRASAIYDIVVTSPLAIPGVDRTTIDLLKSVNVSWGGAWFSSPNEVGMLFVHLVASLVTVWSGLRIWRPRREFAIADVAARGLFSIAFLELLFAGNYPLVIVLLVFEVLWGLVQAGAVALYQNDEFSPCYSTDTRRNTAGSS